MRTNTPLGGERLPYTDFLYTERLTVTIGRTQTDVILLSSDILSLHLSLVLTLIWWPVGQDPGRDGDEKDNTLYYSQK